MIHFCADLHKDRIQPLNACKHQLHTLLNFYIQNSSSSVTQHIKFKRTEMMFITLQFSDNDIQVNYTHRSKFLITWNGKNFTNCQNWFISNIVFAVFMHGNLKAKMTAHLKKSWQNVWIYFREWQSWRHARQFESMSYNYMTYESSITWLCIHARIISYL